MNNEQLKERVAELERELQEAQRVSTQRQEQIVLLERSLAALEAQGPAAKRYGE